MGIQVFAAKGFYDRTCAIAVSNRGFNNDDIQIFKKNSTLSNRDKPHQISDEELGMILVLKPLPFQPSLGNGYYHKQLLR